MMDPNWRVALDLLSVCALFITAAVALAAFRFQKKTTEAMQAEKVTDRLTALEEARASAPSKSDFTKLENRVAAVERHTSGLESSVARMEAALDGVGKMVQGISNNVQLIQTHLLAQARGADE